MKTWVEVEVVGEVNGPWRWHLQARVPLTPDEIVSDSIRCAAAGAVREVGGEIATAEHVRTELRKSRAGVLVLPTAPLPWATRPTCCAAGTCGPDPPHDAWTQG